MPKCTVQNEIYENDLELTKWEEVTFLWFLVVWLRSNSPIPSEQEHKDRLVHLPKHFQQTESEGHWEQSLAIKVVIIHTANIGQARSFSYY